MQTLGLFLLVWTLAAFGLGMILGKFMRKGDHPEAAESLFEAKQSRQSSKLRPQRVLS